MFKDGHGKAHPFKRGSQAGEKMALKGLFADGIWQCNCEPRLPAIRLQCKNGKENHGRWCEYAQRQKPQPKQCNFFLWDSEAKPREGKDVLNNSHTEPQTPTGQTITRSPITSFSGSTQNTSTIKSGATIDLTSPGPSSSPAVEPESPNTLTEFDWPDSNNDELSCLTDAISKSMPPPLALPGTPRKAQKTSEQSTPGKRKHDDMAAGTGMGMGIGIAHAPWPTPSKAEDVFSSTPQSTNKNLFTYPVLPTPNITPSTTPSHTPSESSTPLSAEILYLLTTHSISLSPSTTAAIQDVCNRYTLKTAGIEKGREVARQTLKNKDARMVKLQGRIASLEVEREGLRAVVRGLRGQVEGGGRGA
ncbi:MAG: hypothetical protein MMC33_009230 [Icmadophila ericetorum]|nr:hypothetical protein [Icmadophila ericetorum]